MSEEQSPFAKSAGGGGGGGGGSGGSASASDYSSGPIYSDQTASQVRVERGLFIAAKVNLLVTVILCIVRAAMRPVNAGFYLMYALSLCFIVGLELYLIQLSRLGELGHNRRWFLYMFAIFLFVQCICTDIFIYM